MAYNKSKNVEVAQKLLNQGKVAQAIAEYQNILKYEPRDQVTLMTIGELYIRQGETFQAIDYFERLAQIFVGDGFLTKANRGLQAHRQAGPGRNPPAREARRPLRATGRDERSPAPFPPTGGNSPEEQSPAGSRGLVEKTSAGRTR